MFLSHPKTLASGLHARANITLCVGAPQSELPSSYPSLRQLTLAVSRTWTWTVSRTWTWTVSRTFCFCFCFWDCFCFCFCFWDRHDGRHSLGVRLQPGIRWSGGQERLDWVLQGICGLDQGLRCSHLPVRSEGLSFLPLERQPCALEGSSLCPLASSCHRFGPSFAARTWKPNSFGKDHRHLGWDSTIPRWAGLPQVARERRREREAQSQFWPAPAWRSKTDFTSGCPGSRSPWDFSNYPWGYPWVFSKYPWDLPNYSWISTIPHILLGDPCFRNHWRDHFPSIRSGRVIWLRPLAPLRSRNSECWKWGQEAAHPATRRRRGAGSVRSASSVPSGVVTTIPHYFLWHLKLFPFSTYLKFGHKNRL